MKFYLGSVERQVFFTKDIQMAARRWFASAVFIHVRRTNNTNSPWFGRIY